MYPKCIQIILKFLLLAKLKKVRHVYLRAVRSPGTKRVQFIKENHTRCRISCSLKYLPDSSLTLTYILRYNTEKDFFNRWEMCVKKNSISSCSEPLFQSESKCESIDMKIIFYSRANKTHFHKRSFALSLVLKARVFGTRKRPIMVMLEGKRVIHVNFEFLNSIGPRAHIGRAKILAYPP